MSGPVAATAESTPAKELSQGKSRSPRGKETLLRTVKEGLASHWQPLDEATRAYFESILGHDFASVRVHNNSEAAESARRIKADAYSVGNDIVFASGRYRPWTAAGNSLIAHELVHAVQQRKTPAVTRDLQDVTVTNPSDPVETEASYAARHIEAGSPARISSSYPGGILVVARQPATTQEEVPVEPSESADMVTPDAAPAKSTQEEHAPKPTKDVNKTMADSWAETRSKNQEKVTEISEAFKAADEQALKKEGADSDTEPGSIGELDTSKLALIDEELAEHQRWGEAGAIVGEAGSAQRAAFVAQAAAEGAKGGLTSGLTMGFGMAAGSKVAEKLVEKGAISLATRVGAQAAKFTPLPAVGAVIGGVMSAYDLASRDWKATGEAIGRFGQGSSIYEQLANNIEAISTIIDVASQILNVIAGVIGGISIAMWVISILTVGVASPLAATLSAISAGIGIGTMILDGINALVLKQLITIFRTLHTFTSEADPRDVVTQGTAIEQAAGASAGFVGGLAGGLAGGALADKGMKGLSGKEPSTHVPDHPTPGPAAGDGPTVKAEPPVEGVTAEGRSIASSETTTSVEAPAAGKTGEAPLETASATHDAGAPAEGPTPKAERPSESTTSLTESASTSDVSDSVLGTEKPKPPEASPPAPEEGHIVWAAMEQLGEKFEMDAGIAPGDRIRLQRKQANLKDRFYKNMEEAGYRPVETGKEVSNIKWEPVEGKANPKKAARAKKKYEEGNAAIANERLKVQEEARKEFFKSENKPTTLDLGENFDAAWNKSFIDIETSAEPGALPTGGSTEPARVLPLKEPPRVKSDTETAQPGLVGRHKHQPPRGEQFISEHIMPGAQWEAITKGKKEPIYGESQYNYDYTMLFGKEEARIKTHEGPTSDNARTRALKKKIAEGERVDIIQDIFLPSIDETIRARDIAQQRREAQAAQATPSPLPQTEDVGRSTASTPSSDIETPETAITVPKPIPSENTTAGEAAAPALSQVSHLPPATRSGMEIGEKKESQLSRNVREAINLDISSMTTGESFVYAAGGPVGGAFAVTSARSFIAGFNQARRDPVVERVNPNYPSPPGTPQDVVDIQNQMLQTLDARAKAEAAKKAMAKQEAHHKANEKPLTDMQQKTDEAISATEAHKQAVARRKEANEKKKENETKAKGTLEDYSTRAAKLAAITVPMRGFERFTSLAYSLPDSPSVLRRAKRNIIKVNTDSRKFLDQLAQMDSTINKQKAGQGERDQQIQNDANTLDQTDKKAQDSGQDFDQAKQTTNEFDTNNKTRIEEATKLRTEASQTSAKLDAEAQQKQAKTQSLAAALQAWAHSHRRARLDALVQTKKRLENMGYKVTEVKER